MRQTETCLMQVHAEFIQPGDTFALERFVLGEFDGSDERPVAKTECIVYMYTCLGESSRDYTSGLDAFLGEHSWSDAEEAVELERWATEARRLRDQRTENEKLTGGVGCAPPTRVNFVVAYEFWATEDHPPSEPSEYDAGVEWMGVVRWDGLLANLPKGWARAAWLKRS